MVDDDLKLSTAERQVKHIAETSQMLIVLGRIEAVLIQIRDSQT